MNFAEEKAMAETVRVMIEEEAVEKRITGAGRDDQPRITQGSRCI